MDEMDALDDKEGKYLVEESLEKPTQVGGGFSLNWRDGWKVGNKVHIQLSP